MSFIAFESRLESNRPEIIPGLRPAICDGNAPWGYPVLDRTKVNIEHLAGVMKRCRDLGAPLIFDIEHLKLDIRNTPIVEVNKGIALLRDIGSAARDIDPSVRLGHYALMPRGDYFTLVQYALSLRDDSEHWYIANRVRLHAAYVRWQQANRYVIERLADTVDMFCPSLYTFWSKGDSYKLAYWQLNARLLIAEAKKYLKPVYPFLWECYHDNGSGNHNVPAPMDYWRGMLETCKAEADGVVIWGGYQHPWNADAEWLRVIREATA